MACVRPNLENEWFCPVVRDARPQRLLDLVLDARLRVRLMLCLLVRMLFARSCIRCPAAAALAAARGAWSRSAAATASNDEIANSSLTLYNSKRATRRKRVINIKPISSDSISACGIEVATKGRNTTLH